MIFSEMVKVICLTCMLDYVLQIYIILYIFEYENSVSSIFAILSKSEGITNHPSEIKKLMNEILRSNTIEKHKTKKSFRHMIENHPLPKNTNISTIFEQSMKVTFQRYLQI